MLTTILKLLEFIPAAVAKTSEFKGRIDQIKETLSTDDQAELQAAYDDLVEDSDEAHDRFQERLKAAAEAE